MAWFRFSSLFSECHFPNQVNFQSIHSLHCVWVWCQFSALLFIVYHKLSLNETSSSSLWRTVIYFLNFLGISKFDENMFSQGSDKLPTHSLGQGTHHRPQAEITPADPLFTCVWIQTQILKTSWKVHENNSKHWF